MRKVLATATVACLPLFACGDSGVERAAHVNGFDFQRQEVFTTPVWHQVTDAETQPSGEVRNVLPRLIDVCVLQANPAFFDDEGDLDYLDIADDPGCFSGCDFFSSDDTNHCARTQEFRYSYEELRHDTAAVCRPDDFKSEVKPNHPRRDEACVRNAQANGYDAELPVDTRIVYVSYQVPHDDGSSEAREGHVAVSAPDFATYNLRDEVTIREQSGSIIAIQHTPADS